MQPSLFRDLPLWFLYLLTVLIVLGSVEAGYRLGLARRQRSNEKDAPISGPIGATLGLLAFMLAFTFGAASSRFDTRRQLVLQESNAIGTAYLRTDILDEPDRTGARDALVQYARLRAEGVTTLLTAEAQAVSVALQDRVWRTAVTATQANPNSPAAALYMQSLNDMIDTDESRLTAGRSTIPDTIWLTMYVLTMFSMAAMGYQFGLAGERSWGTTVLLVLAFTVVMVLIADLDRPQSGSLRVSQQPMIDLLNRIAPGQ